MRYLSVAEVNRWIPDHPFISLAVFIGLVVVQALTGFLDAA